ncbi:MAG: hypothetical protein ACREK6_02980 [Candidatus Rokuibacteriota bacterium]
MRSTRLRWPALSACWLAACWLALGADQPRLAGAEPGTPLLQLAQAPPRVIGCEITVDISRTVNCLRSAVDREVRNAERETRRAAESEISKLQSQVQSTQKQLASVERDAAKELTKAELEVKREIRRGEMQLAAAQKQVAELQQQLANNVFLAQLAWQRALLTQIKKQEALFKCLESSNVDIARLLNEFSANPGAFAQARAQDVIRSATSTISTAITTELDNLGRGLAASASDRTVLIRRGTDMMIRVAEQLAGGRCLIETIPPPLRAQIEATIGGVLNEAERHARTVMNERILPAVRAGLATQLRGGFESVVKVVPSPIPAINQEIEKRVPFLQGLTLTEREMRAVARGVLLERQYEAAFRTGSEALEALASTVAAGSTTAAVDQARQRAETALKSPRDYDQLYAAIGVELLRAIGHKYIDSERVGHGGFLLNQGFSLLQLSGGTIQNVTAALCGLIPEIGGVICGYVMQIVVTVWNGAIVPQLQREVAQLIHLAADTSMDRVRSELAKGVKLAEVRSRLGPADAVIAALPGEALLAAWANGFIDNDVKSIDRFTGSVLSLTSAAVQRR